MVGLFGSYVRLWYGETISNMKLLIPKIHFTLQNNSPWHLRILCDERLSGAVQESFCATKRIVPGADKRDFHTSTGVFTSDEGISRR